MHCIQWHTMRMQSFMQKPPQDFAYYGLALQFEDDQQFPGEAVGAFGLLCQDFIAPRFRNIDNVDDVSFPDGVLHDGLRPAEYS
jgi:hypothetical protein